MSVHVLALFADRSGCGQYRVMLPAAAVNLRENDLGIHIECSDHIPADAVRTSDSFTIRRVDVPGGVNVIVFQRPLKAALAGAIRWLRHYRPDVGIVVDLDDDLANVPTSNAAHYNVHPRYSPEENFRWLRQSIAHADVLTVSTPALAELYGYDKNRTFVVRNAVPASMLDQPARALSRNRGVRYHEENRDRVIGWGGTITTHAGDLEVTCNALQDVVASDVTDGRRVSFRQIGPRDGVAAALGLREEDVEASGWISPELYRVALGELDVGIVPLADNRFNRGKSALKVLELAAAGVPVICSATPEHLLLRDQGAPFWVVKNRRREWSKALRSILGLDDSELRELAIAHREFVRRFHTMDHRATHWAHAWRTAAQLVQGERAVTAPRSPLVVDNGAELG